MTNMLQSGAEYLAKELRKNASGSVTIFRNGKRLGEFKAVLARSEFDDVDATGRRSTVYVVDFLFTTSDGYRPQSLDRILCCGAMYNVRPIANELWRYDDPYKVITRVHAQEETAR